MKAFAGVVPDKPVKEPVFNRTDSRFKILILPFDAECTNEHSTTYDIGDLISKRLQDLASQDSLSLVTHFYTDTIDLRNFSSEKADSISKVNFADQIVYG